MRRSLTPAESAAGHRLKAARAALVKRLVLADSRAEATGLCADWVEDPPDVLAGVDVHVLIESCYAVGAELSDQILTVAKVFKAVRLGELTHTQRSAISAALRMYGAGVPRDKRRRRAA